MGTNYYAKTFQCEHCGHKPEDIHLGKSSSGWVFSFQYNGGRFYKDVEGMKEWLVGKQIVDEYGHTIDNDVFWELVESKQKQENLNHAKEYADKYERVIGGYSFSDREFS